MDPRIKNPHTFDMSDFYNGKIVVLGGRDPERENLLNAQEDKEKEKKQSHKLDWSFLKKKPSVKHIP